MPPRKPKKPKLEYTCYVMPLTRARIKLTGIDYRQALQTVQPGLADPNKQEICDSSSRRQIQTDQTANNASSSESIVALNSNIRDEGLVNVYQEANSQSHSSVEISPAYCMTLLPKTSESVMNVCLEANSQSHNSVQISPAYYMPSMPKTSESVMNVYQEANSQSHSLVEISPVNYMLSLPKISESEISVCLDENSQSHSLIEISPADYMPLLPKISESEVSICLEANSQSHGLVEIPSAYYMQLLRNTSEPVMNVCQKANSQSYSLVEISPAYYMPLLPKTSESVMNVCQELNSQSRSSAEISPANYGRLLPNMSSSIFVPHELQTPWSTNGNTSRGIHSLAVKDSDINASSKSLLTKASSEQPPFIDVENKHSETQGSEKKTMSNNKPIRKRRERKQLVINWRFHLPERLARWMLSKKQREDILKHRPLPSGQL